jgi:LPXTG-motif cell wall-anchored protein
MIVSLANYRLHGRSALGAFGEDLSFLPGITLSGDHGQKVTNYLINGVASGKLHDAGRLPIDPIPPGQINAITTFLNAYKNWGGGGGKIGPADDAYQSIQSQLTAMAVEPPEFDNAFGVGDTSAANDASWRYMADGVKQTIATMASNIPAWNTIINSSSNVVSLPPTMQAMMTAATLPAGYTQTAPSGMNVLNAGAAGGTSSSGGAYQQQNVQTIAPTGMTIFGLPWYLVAGGAVAVLGLGGFFVFRKKKKSMSGYGRRVRRHRRHTKRRR